MLLFEWIARLQEILTKYAPVKDKLSITSGLLLRGNRVVILQCLLPEMPNKLYARHQGISKSH